MIKITLTKKGWVAVIIGIFAAIIILTLAYFLGIIALIITFITMAINFIWGLLVWVAAQLGLTAIFGWILTQLAAVWAWFATTWLGSLIMPIYSWIIPILSKFGPFLTMGKWGRKLWRQAMNLRKSGKKEIPLKIEEQPKD